MLKKLLIKHSQNQYIFALLLLAVILTVIIFTFIMYFWQKSVASAEKNNLQNEIKSLRNGITLIQKNTAKTISEPSKEIAQDGNNVFTFNPDINFKECGYASLFKFEKWYPDFVLKLKEKGLTPKGISSSCLSDKAEMLIFIAQEGKYCEGPKIYRYNIQKPYIESATVNNKGVLCLGSLDKFGKREGNVISVVAPGGDGGCRREEHYNYDFIKNTIELIKSRSLCQGDTDWKWTEY